MMITVATQAFRDVMARVCTPVCVVTALDGHHPHGTTVSAFASLSLTPPMVLVSLDRGSDLLSMVRTTRLFAVNILSSGQADLALRFARKGADKFHGISWDLDAGVPRLSGLCGWLVCTVSDLIDGGDHVVALGTVTAAQSSPGDPLTYYARTFGTHAIVDVPGP
jgi:flavin reductase (DIM6/NTAB) family NADH-FMN oxidoreductase RutF